MKTFKCLLCGFDNGYDVVKETLRGGDKSLKAVRCRSCGLEQLYPLPTMEEDKAYYDKNVHDRSITPDFSIDEIFENLNTRTKAG